MNVIAFRLPADLVRRVDDYAATIARRTPGLRVTRGDAVRILLSDALDRAGRKEPRHGKA